MDKFPEDFTLSDIYVRYERGQQKLLAKERKRIVRLITEEIEKGKNKVIYLISRNLNEDYQKQLISELLMRFPNCLRGENAGRSELITEESQLFPMYIFKF